MYPFSAKLPSHPGCHNTDQNSMEHHSSVSVTGLFNPKDKCHGHLPGIFICSALEDLEGHPVCEFPLTQDVKQEAGPSSRTKVVAAFFERGVLTCRKGAALIEVMVGRGLGAECRPQMACAHPPFLSSLKSLWVHLLRAPDIWFGITVTKENSVFWVEGHTSRTTCLTVWLWNPHHTWQSEFSGDGRQTSQQGDLHRARALESEGPGSSLDLLALWLLRLTSPSLSFLVFTMGRIRIPLQELYGKGRTSWVVLAYKGQSCSHKLSPGALVWLSDGPLCLIPSIAPRPPTLVTDLEYTLSPRVSVSWDPVLTVTPWLNLYNHGSKISGHSSDCPFRTLAAGGSGGTGV